LSDANIHRHPQVTKLLQAHHITMKVDQARDRIRRNHYDDFGMGRAEDSKTKFD
jgi:hypothetical protein